MQENFFIPADVPPDMRSEFLNNYSAMTFSTGNFFLLAADHKMEHLDGDTFGPGISPEAHNPEHFFKIAQQSKIGALATQQGLIARYGSLYPKINYVIKLNSKTNIIPRAERDPFSKQLWSIDEVSNFKRNSKLPIRGIGLTIYLGSDYEDQMLEQAAHSIYQAHQAGLVAILWMYPRGHAIEDDSNWHLIAGAAGVAACLGADFVKLHPPHPSRTKSSLDLLKLVIEAAGNTKVIIAGGERRAPEIVIEDIKKQIAVGTSGAAMGRNIWQHSLEDAVVLANSIASIIYKSSIS